MTKSTFLGQIGNFLLYITLQLAVAQWMVRLPIATCYLYVGFLLGLPTRPSSLPRLLCLGFAVGLLVDVLYNCLGVHAFAVVLMMYSRAFLLKLLLPAGEYGTEVLPTWRNMGWWRFSVFALLLIGLHHTALFLLEAWDRTLLWVSLRKALASTGLTYGALCVVQGIVLWFHKKQN